MEDLLICRCEEGTICLCVGNINASDYFIRLIDGCRADRLYLFSKIFKRISARVDEVYKPENRRRRIDKNRKC